MRGKVAKSLRKQATILERMFVKEFIDEGRDPSRAPTHREIYQALKQRHKAQ